MDIASYLQKKCALIDQKLEQLIPERDVPYRQLFKAARYALIGGGKRLRPLLTLVTTETLGAVEEHALGAACAIEMIHTYSLIHDDLPCMDDDDYRRGKLSLHKAFGEGHAVLAGDYLLTYAFDVIANDPHLKAEQKVALIALLAKNAGAKGMLAGQVMDIEAEGLQIDIDTLHTIHQHKTGAMITASIEFGSIIGNASDAHHKILHHFGNDLGLAYQIIDDVIDVSASKEKHGKAVASDQINNKTTYVTLLGVEAAQLDANRLLDRALERLTHLPCRTPLLEELAKRLVRRNI